MGPARDSTRIGRDALRPTAIPWQGWRQILIRVYQSLMRDNVTVIAAGVAFWAILAVFPGVAAIISAYGLLADPAQARADLEGFATLMPPQARQVLFAQVDAIVGRSPQALSAGALVSLFLTIWSAKKGIMALMAAINIAYGEEERRSLVRAHLIALALTAAGVLFMVFTLVLVAGVPLVLGFLPLRDLTAQVWLLLRWPVLAALAVLAIALFYRHAPSRRQARMRWVSWGAVVATLLWLAASAGLSFYVQSFGTFNETYGTLGAVVVLLVWLFLSALALLIGAQLNAEIEHQTNRNSTVGRWRPMGKRGAHVADTEARIP
jgi:membrane protein